MTGIRRARTALLVVLALTALAVPAAAPGDSGSGGGGGGGGGNPPPPPATAPAVTFTPTSLTFAAQAIGTTSAPQSIAVMNTGSAPLFINSAATRGANPLDFTQVSDGCSGVTLAAGTSCSVAITFSPTASGTRSATFILTDNAANSPQSVFVNNFFTTTFSASGGTAPYTWSGQVSAGLTLRQSGLLLGAPGVKGTSTFRVTVTDAAGATAT